jgi:protein phosphatase 2C-like protein
VSDAEWRAAHASVIGTSHTKTGLPCQDAASCQVVCDPDGRHVLLAVACDGAGSASRSLDGATLTVDRFLRDFGDASRRWGLDGITKEFVEDWLSRVRAEIRDRAETDDLSPREFACTILGAVVGHDRVAFFQIGDGAIVVSNRAEPDDYGWVFWPQHGEFANQTNFITQENALGVLEFELEERCVDEIAIFTDGIERLVLDLQEKTAHAPFFRTLFGWLAKTDPVGAGEEIPPSEVVSRYLGSKQINDRTDDDKTLILASRRPAPTTQDLVDAGTDQSEARAV